jgi:hypothetical protein
MLRTAVVRVYLVAQSRYQIAWARDAFALVTKCLTTKAFAHLARQELRVQIAPCKVQRQVIGYKQVILIHCDVHLEQLAVKGTIFARLVIRMPLAAFVMVVTCVTDLSVNRVTRHRGHH